MVQDIKISYIIPMYNVSHFLRKCVDSITGQNFTESFEILIINDGSTDDSLEMAKSIAEEVRQIKIFDQENKGLGGARNSGLDNANGKYILFLDPDDTVAPNSVSKLIKLAESKDLDILEFSAIGINNEKEAVYTAKNSCTEILSGIKYYKTVRYLNSACNKIYKNSFVQRHSLRFLERIFIEDFEFNTRAFYLAKRVSATDMVGAYFLQTENSITRTSDLTKIIKMQDDLMNVISITDAQYKNSDLSDADGLTFYEERLGYLIATLFYQLFKRRAPFIEIKNLINDLKAKDMFYINFEVYDRSKNLFRLILLRNIFLYPYLMKFRR